MRAELLKMSIFAPNKLCGWLTVIAPKSRTTLILDRQTVSKLNKFVENSLHSL